MKHGAGWIWGMWAAAVLLIVCSGCASRFQDEVIVLDVRFGTALTVCAHGKVQSISFWNFTAPDLNTIVRRGDRIQLAAERRSSIEIYDFGSLKILERDARIPEGCGGGK